MASPHVEWFAFARSMGWDPVSSKKGLGVKSWIIKKKEILSQEHSVQIAEAVFHHKSRWHQDVLTTLREYPKASDAMLEILKAKMNQVIKAIKADELAEKLPQHQRPESEFKKFTSGELACLASAIRTVTETKYKSLLLADWNIKVSEAVSTPEAMKKEQEKSIDAEWTIEVMGHEKMKAKDLQNALNEWYDRPMLPHTKEELDAES